MSNSPKLTLTGFSTHNPRHAVVKRGDIFLAVVSFDGPRDTLVVHQGALYADERKEVYRLHAALNRKGAPKP